MSLRQTTVECGLIEVWLRSQHLPSCAASPLSILMGWGNLWRRRFFGIPYDEVIVVRFSILLEFSSALGAQQVLTGLSWGCEGPDWGGELQLTGRLLVKSCPSFFFLVRQAAKGWFFYHHTILHEQISRALYPGSLSCFSAIFFGVFWLIFSWRCEYFMVELRRVIIEETCVSSA